jgi:hypothetical protein
MSESATDKTIKADPKADPQAIARSDGKGRRLAMHYLKTGEYPKKFEDVHEAHAYLNEIIYQSSLISKTVKEVLEEHGWEHTGDHRTVLQKAVQACGENVSTVWTWLWG